MINTGKRIYVPSDFHLWSDSGSIEPQELVGIQEDYYGQKFVMVLKFRKKKMLDKKRKID